MKAETCGAMGPGRALPAATASANSSGVTQGTCKALPGGNQSAAVLSRCIKARDAGPPPQEKSDTREKSTNIFQMNSIHDLHFVQFVNRSYQYHTSNRC